MLTITKEFKIDASHRLVNSNLTTVENEKVFGKCFNYPSHGHCWHLFITVTSDKLENGMIVNFNKLSEIVNKNIIEEFDHKFLNWCPALKDKIVTCENMCEVMWDILQPELNKVSVDLVEIKLYETETSYATYSKPKEKIVEIQQINFKNLSADFKNRLIKMFKDVNIDTEVPTFDWTNKKCEVCKKTISSFSEWCVFHFKKRRDFCSQKCFEKFNEDYKELKRIEELKKFTIKKKKVGCGKSLSNPFYAHLVCGEANHFCSNCEKKKEEGRKKSS